MSKTIKELADELGVSKVRIQQVIDKLPITKKPIKENNKYILNNQNIKDIKGFIGKKIISNRKEENDNLSISYRKVIDNQIEQLNEKDKQIEHLQKLLENQQVLTLQSQEKIKLLESKKEYIGEEKKKRKWSFWK